MAKARHINSNARGVDPNAIARDQDMLGNVVRDGAAEVDMDLAMEQGQSIAGMFLKGDAKMADAFPSFVRNISASGDLGQLEAVRHALTLIEQQKPGSVSKILSAAGSPESLAMDFQAASSLEGAAQETPPPAAAQKPSQPRSLEEQLSSLKNYGSGGRQRDAEGRTTSLVKSLGDLAQEEYRSKQQRLSGVDPSNMSTWQQRLYEYLANSDAYRAAREQQLASMDGIAITPEMAAQFSPQQASQIFSALTGSPEFPGAYALIGMKLTPDAAQFMPRSQRDAMVGQVRLSDLSEEQLMRALAYGGEGDANAQLRDSVSTRDQKIAGMMGHAERGTEPVLDDWFKWWRYQFPIAQGGDIVRPGLAPSGEAMARFTKGTLRLGDELPNWVSTMAPVFNRAIRQQAATPPKTTTYRNMPGRTAQDFANLLLEPYRGGVYLKQAEQSGWPFPLFTEGLPMNFGPKSPINLGGLLLDDTISAPQPDPTINTPDEVPPPVAPEAPPVMPPDGDVSMYDPRMQRMNPSILAALLA